MDQAAGHDPLRMAESAPAEGVPTVKVLDPLPPADQQVSGRPSTKATLVPPKPSELEIASLRGRATGRKTGGISRSAGSSGSAFTDGAIHPPRRIASVKIASIAPAAESACPV